MITAPVGKEADCKPTQYTAAAGALLGLTNPKTYLAFASLLATPQVLVSDPTQNIVIKCVLCIAVMVVVDVLWLWVGVALGGMRLRDSQERTLNIGLGIALLLSAVSAWNPAA